MSHHLTVEARDKAAITSLRLLTVLTVVCLGNVGPEADAARQEARASSSGARLVLTAFSSTSPRHVVRKAG